MILRKKSTRVKSSTATTTAKVRRTRAIKPPPEMLLPEPLPQIKEWYILGLDPSLSRTGYALQHVRLVAGGTEARWVDVGSIKPTDASDPIWIRSKNIALFLRSLIPRMTPETAPEVGLILSLEYPTPANDFLVALNRIIHLVLFDGPGVPIPKDDLSILSNNFGAIRILHTNAATLRSLMGLTMRGAKNKVENIAKAYTFIDRDRFPNLDTDSCDAVLLAMMGRHAASLLLNHPEQVPSAFMLSLTNATKEIKGKGTRARTITKGLLHRPEYWTAYEPRVYGLMKRDARDTTRKLHPSQAVI